MKQSHKTILLWALLIFLFVMIYNLISDGTSGEETLDTTEFKTLLQARIDERLADAGEGPALSDDRRALAQRAGEIASVTVEPNPNDNATYVLRYEGSGEDGLDPDKKTLVYGEYKGTIENLLTAAGISYEVKAKEESTFWQSLLISWLPMLLLFALFFFFMRQLQAGGGKAMSFGKSKARLLTDHQNKVTFKDVAGVEEAKDEVEEIIAFLKDPKKFTRLGGRIPKGVLMMGPPGTGKTLLARAIAGEAGVPFFSISGSDFVEMFVGVGASRVRDLFEQGKKNAPCIIFIDEIDAVGRHRGAGLGGGHDEREQTLNQLLVEMDGFESNDGVILIAATNRPDVLDPALLRPGRFDRRIIVPRPDLRGRTGILGVHTRKVPLSTEVALEVIARGTPGFSGADLESLVNEAALIAARRDKDRVDMEDFEDAKDKVMMGAERRSMIISDKEKRTTAYHEAGHALVAKLVGAETDPVHKVSIIPRGRALGVTQLLPTEDRLGFTREFALNKIAILMGGRLAEELVLKQKTTGAGDDIDKATDLARRMVTEWGMSDVIGPLNFASGGKQEVFLGRDLPQAEAYSQETAQRIDGEIRRIVTDQYERARRMLEENRDALERVARGLLEYETLDGNDIDTLCQGGRLSRPAVVSKPSADAESSVDEDEREARPALFPPLGKSGTDPEPEPA
ncbi:ATP-dependent zinc metalloprotease FtsH [Haliangium ochraceum]|uniref:ATP-dependent zinc metalloprotease FtsH n=1 Tax=Haliangium ochraceum (strain DSM 14365 / JCM 11303 / SMP-2) TaxID=502025 RepID=FTSH_HALO1|nr:ATP-dependent zinc metalloprotease FtsH [Haliangium ochraceum]D0LWB8.1 RecName: Full=ATP-dependent zinc metalloprotease FtsH [Haliangium ochraceum DSM 14365]ACY16050.1 ATP-dependent metalloprotease FtsH [Haliangium ochraceum DSM 14365]